MPRAGSRPKQAPLVATPQIGRPPPAATHPSRGGNPSTYLDARIAARQYWEDAMKKQVEIMNNKEGNVPPAVQLAAAELIITRAFGKPAQAVEVTGPDNESTDRVVADAERFTRTITLLAARANPGTIDGEIVE